MLLYCQYSAISSGLGTKGLIRVPGRRRGGPSTNASSTSTGSSTGNILSCTMFKKKSFRGLKEITTATTSSSPEPAGAAAAVAPVPRPVAPLPKKKVEAPPKPVAPPSIVPPGTKRVLVVGKGVVMTADVENCDAVIVQGNLDGNIRAKYIVIMQGEHVEDRGRFCWEVFKRFWNRMTERASARTRIRTHSGNINRSR